MRPALRPHSLLPSCTLQGRPCHLTWPHAQHLAPSTTQHPAFSITQHPATPSPISDMTSISLVLLTSNLPNPLPHNPSPLPSLPSPSTVLSPQICSQPVAQPPSLESPSCSFQSSLSSPHSQTTVAPMPPQQYQSPQPCSLDLPSGPSTTSSRGQLQLGGGSSGSWRRKSR